jgi:hypothetical protein
VVEADFSDGTSRRFKGTALDKETSGLVFRRTGDVVQITVSLRETHLT